MAVLLHVVNHIFLRAQLRTLLSPAITIVTIRVVVTLIIVIIIQPVLIFFFIAILVLVILHLLLRWQIHFQG